MHRVDEAGLIGLRLDLPAQAGDRVVHRPRRGGIVGITPHRTQQLAAVDDATGPPGQEPPGALPSVLVGLRFSLGLMWVLLIVAETVLFTLHGCKQAPGAECPEGRLWKGL